LEYTEKKYLYEKEWKRHSRAFPSDSNPEHTTRETARLEHKQI